jgi:hypothetical protein
MLIHYADLLWQVPFWVGLAIATVAATLAWARTSRRAANCAFVVVWMLAVPWALAFVWNASLYDEQHSRKAPDARQLDEAESRYRRSQEYGIALGIVFVFATSALLRVRSRTVKPRPALKQRLEAEYRKKLAESDYEPDSADE